MVLAMGRPPTDGESNRSESGHKIGLPRVRIVWPDDAPQLKLQAELIDRLFGSAIADLFKDSS